MRTAYTYRAQLSDGTSRRITVNTFGPLMAYLRAERALNQRFDVLHMERIEITDRPHPISDLTSAAANDNARGLALVAGCI